MKTIQGQQTAIASSQPQLTCTSQLRSSKSRLFVVLFSLVMIIPFTLVSCDSDGVAESKTGGKYETIGEDIDRVLSVVDKINSLGGK